MKNIKYYISIIFFVFIYSCEIQQDVNITKHTINGKIINVNNPTMFDGKKLYLESNYYSAIEGTIIETISEIIVSDSGKFELIYESTPGTALTIKCYEFPSFYKSVSVNKNITPIYYISDSSTLVFVLKSDNPLNELDTLYISYYAPNEYRKTISIIGPKINNSTFNLRDKNSGSIVYNWGKGYNDLKNNGFLRNKNVALSGDPFIDTVNLIY